MRLFLSAIVCICLMVAPYCAEGKQKAKVDPEKAKVERISKELGEMLKKENCTLSVMAITTVNGTEFKVQVVPIPPAPVMAVPPAEKKVK